MLQDLLTYDYVLFYYGSLYLQTMTGLGGETRKINRNDLKMSSSKNPVFVSILIFIGVC